MPNGAIGARPRARNPDAGTPRKPIVRDHALLELELAGQHAAEHAGEEDLVEVEELAEPDDDHRPAVQRGDREPVHPRGDGRLGMACRRRGIHDLRHAKDVRFARCCWSNGRSGISDVAHRE
jgi:hypothetical protein